MRMQYGIHANSGASVTDPAVLRDMAQLAEELGCEFILIGDHILPPQKIRTPFPVSSANTENLNIKRDNPVCQKGSGSEPCAPASPPSRPPAT